MIHDLPVTGSEEAKYYFCVCKKCPFKAINGRANSPLHLHAKYSLKVEWAFEASTAESTDRYNNNNNNNNNTMQNSSAITSYVT